MSTVSDVLPITEVIEPQDQDELASVVQQSFEQKTAIYPIGGGTSLDFGLPARQPGVGLSLAKLGRVIDYPARDMTITVEAGIRMKQLAETLAAEGQQFPVDVPAADRATLGGVVATNFNGPRRYGLGAIRDLVIGISAVDGRGTAFRGGGRVVKNVAGYDFCKLLTGSLGTLGVITQITLKLKPLPAQSAIVACLAQDLEQAEHLLALLAESETTPAAIELLQGPAWKETLADCNLLADADERPLLLAVLVEGREAEVEWMSAQLLDQWRGRGVSGCQRLEPEVAERLRKQLAEFPARDSAPLVIKANVVPSGTTRFVEAVCRVDPDCSIQAHAGNGTILTRFSQVPADGVARSLLSKLVPVASAAHGTVLVLSNSSGEEMTHQSVWGGIDAPYAMMTRIKRQFDPNNLLNPGRFVYI